MIGTTWNERPKHLLDKELTPWALSTIADALVGVVEEIRDHTASANEANILTLEGRRVPVLEFAARFLGVNIGDELERIADALEVRQQQQRKEANR